MQFYQNQKRQKRATCCADQNPGPGVKEDNDSRYSCQKKCDTQQTDMQNMFFTRINSFVVSVILELYQSLGVVINKNDDLRTNVMKERLFYNLQILNTRKMRSRCNHTP